MGLSLKRNIDNNVAENSTVSFICVYLLLFLMRWMLEKAKK